MSILSDNKPVTPADKLAIPTVASGELLKGGRIVIIRHGGFDYRLQVTRSQKLILTK